MNHLNTHHDIQITDAELLQSTTTSIPPISSLINNIQSMPLSLEYNVNTINPTLIDFSLLDPQRQNRDHDELEQKGTGIDGSLLSDDPIGMNQLNSSSSSSSSIPSISSLISGIHPTQLTNDYNINQINPTFGGYDNHFQNCDDSSMLNDFSLHKKLERKSIQPISKTTKDNSPDKDSSITQVEISNTGRNTVAKRAKKTHSMHENDFNNEKYESLANLNSTLDLLVAVSCQINERNQLNKKETKSYQLENGNGEIKLIDNSQSDFANHNQNLSTEKSKAKLQRAKSLPQSAIDIMIEYFDAHSEHPYPSIEDRRKMSLEGKITENQVKAWFANRRNRAKKRHLKATSNPTSNSVSNPCINSVSNESLNTTSNFSSQPLLKSDSISNFAAIINREKMCKSPQIMHNVCERKKENDPIYRSVFKLNPIPSNIMCPDRVNYKQYVENSSEKKENNSHRILLKAKPRTQPKIKQKIVAAPPTAPSVYMFQPVEEEAFQDDSGNTSSADDHYMPSMNDNNFDSINTDPYYHHGQHHNHNVEQISSVQDHMPHFDHTSLPLDNFKFQQHQSKLMANTNANSNNNNLYFPNLNCINKHNSEECLDSCCYLKSNYSSIYNDVSNLNDCPLNESLNDANSLYFNGNVNCNSNNFLNFFSNVNHLGAMAPSCYQNFFQQQKCDTPPPLVTKSSPCRFSSNEVIKATEKNKGTENLTNQTLHLPITTANGNNNNIGFNSDSLNLLNSYCKKNYPLNNIPPSAMQDGNDFNNQYINDTSTPCSNADSNNHSNDSVQNSGSYLLQNNNNFSLNDPINTCMRDYIAGQMQDQESNLDHLDDEYTSPSSNSSSNSSNNSSLKSHGHLSMSTPESYQVLKQQSLLYTGLENNETNGIQSRNFGTESQVDALIDSQYFKANSKKTFVKQNGRFIEARPPVLHPKISSNGFMNILSKK